MAFCSLKVRPVGLSFLVLFCAGLLLGLGPGPRSSQESVEEHLRTRVEAVDDDIPGAASVGDEHLFAAPAVARYYRQRAFQPIWGRSAGPTTLVDSLLTLLRDADRDGLRPADYHVAALDSLLQHLRAQAGSGEPLDPRRVVEEGTTQLRMRAIVGQPYRQTPVFSDQISYLVLNPYWHVPHSIAVKDKLPDFRRDPSLLSKRGYEVFRGWGADATQIDPSTIDWSGVSASNFPYRLRQNPGPQNALGQIKFMFPNAHSVYLHDTPTRSLFGRAERSFSSGCIRVERPLDLATMLLRDNEDWTREHLEAGVGTDAEQTIVLDEKVPVHLLYRTAWSTADGLTHFRRDVYDRDAAVRSALHAPPRSRTGRDATD